MGWENKKVVSAQVFDVEIPDVDFSLDSVFSELTSQLKEERSKKTKKKSIPKATRKKIVSEETVNKRLKSPIEAVAELLPERTADPLAAVNTPKYMTQQEFQNHYKLLLNRLDIQIGSLGGGGAVNIRDMDDVTTEFLTDPASLDGATMKMRYLPQQKILQFYGDNTTLLDQRTISGTTDIKVDFNNNNFEISLSESVDLPGTFNSTGITTLASSGANTNIGGDLHITGMAKATKFTTTSDSRLKTNVRKIEDPLEIISKIEGVKFNWINDGSDDSGVIAQDVELAFPEIVNEHDGIKGVNYNGLIGLLIESVKELSKDNQLLRMEIESLR